MKLNQLRYLVALGAQGSIRASARSLGLAQATVTQGLNDLQASAGVVLLERHGRGVQLTPAGKELLEQARKASGAQIARVLKPTDMITLEYRSERLNLNADDKGVVTRVNCG